jgi:hypothetical protein
LPAGSCLALDQRTLTALLTAAGSDAGAAERDAAAAQQALGGQVKRSAKTVRKVLGLPRCALTEREKQVALWAIGDVTDDEVGLFVIGK